MPLAARVLALSWALGLLPGAAGQVNCGAHVARSCDYCPAGNGQNWCHGQCQWVHGPLGGACMAKEIAPIAPGGLGSAGISLTFVLSGCVMLTFACFYKAKVVDELPLLPWGKPMKDAPPERSIFSCLYSFDTCMYTTFCLPAVAAKNYRSAEVCHFWPACILMFLGTYSPFCCVTAAIRTAFSQRVKDRLGYPSYCLQDFLVSLFCFPCEVGRESLEVDEELGMRISCICRVEKAIDEDYAGRGHQAAAPTPGWSSGGRGGGGGYQPTPLRLDGDMGLGNAQQRFLPAAGSSPYVGPSSTTAAGSSPYVGPSSTTTAGAAEGRPKHFLPTHGSTPYSHNRPSSAAGEGR